MPNYENPQLPSFVEQAYKLHRLLFEKAVEISSATGLNVGEILERIAFMSDSGESSLPAFTAFDDDQPSQATSLQGCNPASPLHPIVLALQYWLKTLEQACHCGRCDQCTRSQDEIKSAISTLESLPAYRRRTRRPRFLLEHQGVRAKLSDFASLVGYVRQLVPSELQERQQPGSLEEVFAIIVGKQCLLMDYGVDPTREDRPAALLQSALMIIRDLLATCELNLDDLEADTRRVLTLAATFQLRASLAGFSCATEQEA